jgi:ribulose-bisphosphate carboxylase large chain
MEQAAAVLAGEQSSGTFVAVAGETEALKQRFAARVENVTKIETVTEPAIPGAASPKGLYHRASVQISWSIENMGYNLPVLVSTLQGNDLFPGYHLFRNERI